MKLVKKSHWSVISTVLPMMLLVTSAHAHDPEEHAEASEGANCKTMKSMDHSKMNMDDAVAQAMMKKCMNKMDSEGMHKTKKMDMNVGESEKMNEAHNHQ
ncbi:MAG: hypothetical protein JKY50_03830 [Oleispira sp.]|nr:hypothetical protein [Oleispira sp.]